LSPGFVSHIENYWDEPGLARWLSRLGSFCRVVIFDKRGTGLSDRVANLPVMDERMDDVRTVMDAVGIERAIQFGISEGGSLATLFAASHPERTQSLIVYGGFARFFHWIPDDAGFDALIGYIDEHWGSGASLPMFAPSKAEDVAVQQWWGKFERLGASPSAAMALMRMNREIDISGILHTVQVPTLVLHVTDDTLVSVEGGRELAVSGGEQPKRPVWAKRPDQLSLFGGEPSGGDVGAPNVPIQPQPGGPDVAGTDRVRALQSRQHEIEEVIRDEIIFQPRRD
jgi:pimeloyl-ACP methyl ester carboxylesterase